ncbi:voltage-sensitive sodium channel [Culex quinquefasciatus]|uniref:Voltage-sensitive sodium channel n=1 Tax=Culex quinquefasciatus TaxID=7176 RepID=B0WM46_CULQU|nr:voltage-sensitive sodium channel [Culex quinquefasciatus]|eukprot:XP_001849780.1 voltage-sensitive sodium channel [Culex quinquefasciatus]
MAVGRLPLIRYDDEDEDEGPQPDSTLEQGVPIPVRMQGSFPPELASTPLEDIDAFYSNIKEPSTPVFELTTFGLRVQPPPAIPPE